MAGQVQGVLLVEKCHTRKMGVMNHADLHIWVDKDLTVEAGHDIAHQVKDYIQKSLPQFINVMIPCRTYCLKELFLKSKIPIFAIINEIYLFHIGCNRNRA